MKARHLAVALLGLGFLLSAATPKEVKTVAGMPAQQALALGERMYRQGLLPSGEPMASVVSGDIPVPGTSFSCGSCHLRAGLGSWEGGVVTLATNGARLAQPRYWKFPNLTPAEREELKLQNPPARPAYTDEALAHVLRTGMDPAGRTLHPIMPCYDLNDRDMAILIHYLRNLSARLSPGVDGETLRFATVITEGVSRQDQEAMLVPLNNYVARHNQFSKGFGNRMYLAVGGNEMTGSYRKLALSVWRLSGAPETWERQLEAHLKKEPVFALLGGLSNGAWAPIHRFCEKEKLPCLFPITDLPVVSDTDWYTLYFSKGYYQEGQAAARFVNGMEDLPSTPQVLQILQEGPEARELAAGFRETWQELGRPAAALQERVLTSAELADAEGLRRRLAQEKVGIVLLWVDARSFPALASFGEDRRMFLSSRLLGPQTTAVPEAVRAFTWITYPYRDPLEEPAYSKYADTLLAGMKERYPERRISTRVYSLIQVLRQGLMDMDRHFYRDNLLDRIGMQRDQALPDYLRLSFGPGQRYASKGCFIMQLSPGANPRLLRRSEWVIH
ncbi:MAG: ABC transporter substrate-binding protein [Firmicutes bacterium]|nr:ABC transporter substrate-binding protein [Bacillota bacterium]